MNVVVHLALILSKKLPLTQEVIQTGDTTCQWTTLDDSTQLFDLKTLEDCQSGLGEAGNGLDTEAKKWLHIVCIPDGVRSLGLTPGGTAEDSEFSPRKAQTPAIAGVVSSGVACRQELASEKKVEAAGIACEKCNSQLVDTTKGYGKRANSCLHIVCTDITLSRLILKWHQLPSHVRLAIQALSDVSH